MKQPMKRLWTIVLATLFTAGMAVFAQDQAGQVTVQTADSEEHGTHLTDGEGNALYLFVDETAGSSGERVTEGVRMEAASCTGGCLDAWPPLEGDDVQASGDVDSELLYTADVDGRTQVVYNGWPLYHFAQDQQPGDVNGHAVESENGTWSLVSPEGQPIGGVGGMAEDQPMQEDGVGEEGVPAEDEPLEDQPMEDQPMEDEPADDVGEDGVGEDQPLDGEPAEDGIGDDGVEEDQPLDGEPAEDDMGEDGVEEDQPLDGEPAEDDMGEDGVGEDQPLDGEPAEDDVEEEENVN